MDHLTDDLLEQLIRETLGPDQQSAAMQHLDTCEVCLQRLASYNERVPNVFRDTTPDQVACHPEYRSSFTDETKAAACGMRATQLERMETASYALNRGKPIGLGGFGQVFEYIEERFQRRVAFKILQDRWVKNPEIVRRFRREMEITSLIDHPGCPTVYGSGTTSDGRDFFWMQLVTGEPLSEMILRSHQPEPVLLRRGNDHLRTLLSMMLQICDVIAVAHEKGIWHRDLKPANIRLHENGFPVVLDWGLSIHSTEFSRGVAASKTVAAEQSAELTRAGDQLGTLAYMSPEAARGEIQSIDHRTDIYSLGGILCAMLTGNAPHAELLTAGVNTKQVLNEIARGHIPPLGEVPAELASICRRALSPAMNERYSTARDLAKDLDRWMAGEVVSAHRYGFAGRARLAISRRPFTFAASTLLTSMAMILLVLGAQWRSDAVQQRSIADQRFGLALEAWKTLITGVQDSLGTKGGTGEVRQKLISEAAGGIQHLITNAGQQPHAELIIIQAKLELAHIQRGEQGDFEGARAAYTALKKQLESMEQTHRLPERYKLLSDALRGMYRCTLSLEGTERANEVRVEFDQCAADLRRDFPGEPVATLMYVQSLILAGRNEEDKGPDFLARALTHFQTAEQAFLSLPEDVRLQAIYNSEYLLVLADEARVLNRLGKVDEAISIQRKVVEEMKLVTEREPLRKNRIGLLEDQMNLALTLKKISPQQAVELLSEISLSAEQLTAESPEDTGIRDLARDIVENLATAYRSNREPDKAVALLEKNRKHTITETIRTTDMSTLLDQAFLHGALGRAYQDLSQSENASTSYRTAIEIRREIYKRDTNNTDSLRELLVVAQAWADTTQDVNKSSAAFLRELCQLVDPDNRSNEYGPQMKMPVAILYRWYGEHSLQNAQIDQSIPAAREAKNAYTRSKELLAELEGVPAGPIIELTGKLRVVEQLIQNFESDISSEMPSVPQP